MVNCALGNIFLRDKDLLLNFDVPPFILSLKQETVKRKIAYK